MEVPFVSEVEMWILMLQLEKENKKKSYNNHLLVSGRCIREEQALQSNSAAGVNFKSSYIRLSCIQAEIAKTKCLKMCVSLYIREG